MRSSTFLVARQRDDSRLLGDLSNLGLFMELGNLLAASTVSVYKDGSED